MSENKNLEEEMIQNAEDEVSEVSEEMIEEAAMESSEDEEAVIKEEKESVEESVEYTPLPEKTKKHIKAKNLIKKAKKVVEEATKRADACRLLLETNLKAYEEARSALHQGGLDECVSLLKQLGQQITNDEEEKQEVVETQKEELKPMVLKDISSGRFTGVLYALFGGLATAIGMVYLATEKLEMTLNVTKVPSENVTESILAWFSTIIGVQENVDIGTGVLGVIVLLAMIFIYVIRVRLKARANLHFAVKQFVEAELYAEQKPDCKEETGRVDAHIKDAIDTLKAYEVLLNEQKGKLQRILYFEGEKEKDEAYHDTSLGEIDDTKELISTIRELIDIPVLDKEKLSDKSVLLLQKAKDKIDAVIKRFY